MLGRISMRAHPARFGQSGFDDGLPPRVVRAGLLRPRQRLDDQVGFLLPELLGEVPALLGRPFLRGRHVLRIALRRAGVDPADHRVDLFVAERAIVLEVLNPDGLVDVPRRHLTRPDAIPDRARPRPCLFVGDQGHRRDRIRPVTGLALLLENAGNIFREGRRRRGLRGCNRRPSDHRRRENETADALPHRGHVTHSLNGHHRGPRFSGSGKDNRNRSARGSFDLTSPHANPETSGDLVI